MKFNKDRNKIPISDPTNTPLFVKKYLSKDEFLEQLNNDLNEIKDLFKLKNTSYGRSNDAFYNFRQSAMRLYNQETPEAMLGVLMVLLDKHMVALANRGLRDAEAEQRFKDIIVYSLIALGIYREYVKNSAFIYQGDCEYVPLGK